MRTVDLAIASTLRKRRLRRCHLEKHPRPKEATSIDLVTTSTETPTVERSLYQRKPLILTRNTAVVSHKKRNGAAVLLPTATIATPTVSEMGGGTEIPESGHAHDPGVVMNALMPRHHETRPVHVTMTAR